MAKRAKSKKKKGVVGKVKEWLPYGTMAIIAASHAVSISEGIKSRRQYQRRIYGKK